MINLLENVPIQPIKFRTKNWFEINDDSRGTYNTNSQIKFKTLMLRSSLYDYNDAYILVKETIIVTNTETQAAPNDRNKKVSEHCAPFTGCISEINNTEIDHAKNIDAAIPMYNLIEYSENYSRTSGSLWQYYRDEQIIDNNGNIVNFPHAPDSPSFKYKEKITLRTGDNGRKCVQIMAPLIHLSNFLENSWNTIN